MFVLLILFISFNY